MKVFVGEEQVGLISKDKGLDVFRILIIQFFLVQFYICM